LWRCLLRIKYEQDSQWTTDGVEFPHGVGLWKGIRAGFGSPINLLDLKLGMA